MKNRKFGGQGARATGGRNGKSRSFGKKFVKKSSNGGWKSVAPQVAVQATGGGHASSSTKRFGGTQKRARPDARKTPPVFVKKTMAAKLVQSLQDKKTRAERRLFLVEGDTSVLEALESGFAPHSLFVTHAFLDEYPQVQIDFKNFVHIVDEQELSGLGTLAVNKSVIGVFAQKQLPSPMVANGVTIALCDISDPGNLGTIIRIADWYGIRTIIASHGTVDAYNPKVVSATKGSFARVNVHYTDLEKFFVQNKTVPVFAADMRGDDVHKFKFPAQGILLLGNETHGIPEDFAHLIAKRITIPRFGGAESLNVAIAGAVILDNWLR